MAQRVKRARCARRKKKKEKREEIKDQVRWSGSGGLRAFVRSEKGDSQSRGL